MVMPDKKWLHRTPGRIVILCTAWILGTVTLMGNTQDDVILNRKGRKYIRERKWERAIQTYEQLVRKYSTSLYRDDALFWIGFSLEQMPGKEAESYRTYQRVVDEYPSSPWADDASIHQISLAKQLVIKGDPSFKTFLHRKTEAPDSAVRYQAALALAELKDPGVLPILEEIARGEDTGLAAMAMDALRQYSGLMEDSVAGRIYPMRAGEASAGDASAGDASAGEPFDALVKQGENWTEAELLLNGLVHIVPAGDLAFFLNLENEWDKTEWWRKFWAARDPTPTTPENEAEEAYRHRVITAHKEFGREWSSEHFYYPPWDARGELIVKFGEPDDRDTTEGPEWELWTYYRYRIAFMVSAQRSNRSGHGIALSPVSQYLFRRNLGYQRAFYIGEPQFLFKMPELESMKKINGLTLRLKSAERSGSRMQVVLSYGIPSSNLRFRAENGRYVGTYRYRWVLYDEDYHPVTSYDAVEEVVRTDAQSLREGDISGLITLTVSPGLYHLGLRIEDFQSKRLGIYKKRFTVRAKGSTEDPQDDTIQ